MAHVIDPKKPATPIVADINHMNYELDSKLKLEKEKENGKWKRNRWSGVGELKQPPHFEEGKQAGARGVECRLLNDDSGLD